MSVRSLFIFFNLAVLEILILILILQTVLEQATLKQASKTVSDPSHVLHTEFLPAALWQETQSFLLYTERAEKFIYSCVYETLYSDKEGRIRTLNFDLSLRFCTGMNLMTSLFSLEFLTLYISTQWLMSNVLC